MNAATVIKLHDRIPVGHGHFIGAGTQPPDLAINSTTNTKYSLSKHFATLFNNWSVKKSIKIIDWTQRKLVKDKLSE